MNFQRYLSAKKSVDDRALNRNVFDTFSKYVSDGKNHSILELGGGIGTMVQRLAEWLPEFDLDYTLIDLDSENINYAKKLFNHSISGDVNNIHTRPIKPATIDNDMKQLRLNFLTGDVYGLKLSEGATWDGIIANAFFDLVDLDSVLPILHNLLKPGGWIYATINFDGCTIFEPVIDEALDSLIIDAYHNSMDGRSVHGVPVSGSQSGRKLYYAFRNNGFKIGTVGSSDWLVYPQNGAYSADEKYFLEVILSFFAESVVPSHLLSQSQINKWLDIRKRQLIAGELLFIAHQLDYFVIKS